MNTQSRSIELDFSNNNAPKHAYYPLLNNSATHSDSFHKRLNLWREASIIKKALHAAGDPLLVLELPCNSGRLWPLLCENSNRNILAADDSHEILEEAQRSYPLHITSRVTAFKTSAYDISLDENQVDCVFSMHLLDTISNSEQRLKVLRELHRVTRDSVIITINIDNKHPAKRHKHLNKQRIATASTMQVEPQLCAISTQAIEREFSMVGFDIIKRLDFLAKISMQRTYVLRKGA